MSAAYSTYAADVARDRGRIIALWRSGLTHRGNPEGKFDWYYGDNPEGAPGVLFLRSGDEAEPVGVASFGTRRMQRDGERLTAGVLADFVVAPAHRSFFPALALQRAIHDRGLERHALLYGMPNPRSEAVVKRAASRHVGDLVRRARVVRSARFLARYIPAPLAAIAGAVVDRVRALTAPRDLRDGLEAEWIERPDARFDSLWARAAPQGVLAGVRDAGYLAWRFCDCPLGHHRFLAITSRAGGLVAYAACRWDDTTLTVADFLADPGHRGAGRRLWTEVARAAWRMGCSSATVEFLGPAAVHREIESAGWVERSRRPFCAAVGGRAELLAPENWYVTTADQDG